jgi:hypothetical protein
MSCCLLEQADEFGVGQLFAIIVFVFEVATINAGFAPKRIELLIDSVNTL